MGMKEVTVKDFEGLVDYCIENGLSLYAEGSAGIGKSTVTAARAKAKNKQMEDIRASTIDVGDLIMRMPDKDQKAMVELVNEMLVKDEPYVLLLDEFRHADPSIRRMFYQIIWDKKIGNYNLPDKTAIIALSNPTDEVDTEEIEAPLFDRFDFKVKIRFEFDEWKEWAYSEEINNDVITFLQHFQEFVNTKIGGNGQTIPVTPRTWERVSNHIDKASYILPHEASTVFNEYRKKVLFFEELDKYLDGTKPLPEAIDYQYAFASALCNKLTNKLDDEIMKRWFIDGKVKGIQEEVTVFINYALLSAHRTKTKKANAASYALALPAELKTKVVSKFKDLGYLMDDKM